MSYIHVRPGSPSFTGKGLLGFTFGPLKQKDMEIYYVEVEKGHDVFMVSKKITRTYYVLAGSGYFTIDNQRYDVGPGILVEVPPGIEYCYSGKMTLISISKPRWFSRNDTFTRWNPDVRRDPPYTIDRESSFTRLVRIELFGKSPVRAWLRLNQAMWDKLPSSFAGLAPIRRYGDFLHMVARRQGERAQALATLFLRNRPELELIGRLLQGVSPGGTLRVTLLACSIGAEAYSVAWKIRSLRPDLKLTFNAVDISSPAVEFAKVGVYTSAASELTNTNVCEALSSDEIDELFQRDGDALTVKPWIKEGIKWQVGDAGDAEVVDALGQQDLVVANNFLCHMSPAEAERCLRNISRLVTPGGYLFVGGIDLDVRTKVASDLSWEPVQELLEEVHDGDSYLRRYWPSLYAGLEPLDKKRKNWRIRYAAGFRIGKASNHEAATGDAQSRSDYVPVLAESNDSVAR
jgi:chemotaxis methyl-accepting protein methylase/mannose-6-phosphate isomerase-like protein (cupin superfamily)